MNIWSTGRNQLVNEIMRFVDDFLMMVSLI